jgi:hypothetical protein
MNSNITSVKEYNAYINNLLPIINININRIHTNSNILESHEHMKYKTIISNLVTYYNFFITNKQINVELKEQIYNLTEHILKYKHNILLKNCQKYKNINKIKFVYENIKDNVEKTLNILAFFIKNNMLEKINKDNLEIIIIKAILLITIFIYFNE